MGKAPMLFSKFERCYWCKKKRKCYKRDPVTRWMCCKKCCKNNGGHELLTLTVSECYDLHEQLAETTIQIIADFVHGVEKPLYTELDLYRLGMQERVTYGTRAKNVRYFYDAISQSQLRLIADQNVSV